MILAGFFRSLISLQFSFSSDRILKKKATNITFTEAVTIFFFRCEEDHPPSTILVCKDQLQNRTMRVRQIELPLKPVCKSWVTTPCLHFEHGLCDRLCTYSLAFLSTQQQSALSRDFFPIWHYHLLELHIFVHQKI